MRRLVAAITLVASSAIASTDGSFPAVLSLFPEGSYLHAAPSKGVITFGGIDALDSQGLYLHARTNGDRTVRLTELCFTGAQEAVRAANAYLKDADPARGEELPWELVVQRGDRLFWVHGSGFTKAEFDDLTSMVLDRLDAKSSPRLVLRDASSYSTSEV